VLLAIHDRYGLLADENGENLVPDQIRRHRARQCDAGRLPGPDYDQDWIGRCHDHCWEDLGNRVSNDQPVLLHHCWRGRRELVVAGMHQGEHVANLFIGPPDHAEHLPEVMLHDCGDLIADVRSLCTQVYDCAVSDGSGLTSTDDERHRLIRRFLMRVESHTTLSDLADALGVSPHRASHVVRELFGRSWRELRVEAGLKRAVFFLKQPRMSISDIARRCGWNDANSFIRQFRQHYGTSPGRWRQEQTTD
jgi:AraC-like DNA-binding protein